MKITLKAVPKIGVIGKTGTMEQNEGTFLHAEGGVGMEGHHPDLLGVVAETGEMLETEKTEIAVTQTTGTTIEGMIRETEVEQRGEDLVEKEVIFFFQFHQ